MNENQLRRAELRLTAEKLCEEAADAWVDKTRAGLDDLLNRMLQCEQECAEEGMTEEVEALGKCYLKINSLGKTLDKSDF